MRGYTLLGIFLDPNYLDQIGLFKGVKLFSRRINGGRLLDFGCGNKPYEFLLIDRVDEYIGVDIETSGHDHSSEKIDYYWDGHTLPFDDGFFDHVISTEVLEHVFDIDRTLDELNRVMCKGADAIITIPFAWEEHEKPYDSARYTQYGLEYLLGKHGFSIVERIKCGSYIQTIYQMKCCYWEKMILLKIRNSYLYHLAAMVLTAPITIRGLLWSFILPDSDELYMNNIIYIKKTDEIKC